MRPARAATARAARTAACLIKVFPPLFLPRLVPPSRIIVNQIFHPVCEDEALSFGKAGRARVGGWRRRVGASKHAVERGTRHRPDQGHRQGHGVSLSQSDGDGSQSVTAAIFWLKTRGGWRETPQDHCVDLRDARDLRYLTNAQLEQIILDANPDFRRRPALPKPGA